MSIPYNVVDTNTYFSLMQQARDGHFLFTNKYTSEKASYLLFNPVYLVIGWMTFFMWPVVAYYLAKFIFLILFVYLVYKLLKLTVRKDELNTSLFFVLFGSGIGYLLILLHNLGLKQYGSIDFWLSESNSVALNIAPVHFVVAVCLMIVTIIFYYKFWQSKRKSHFFVFSLSTLLLGFIHLFDVITLIPVFIFYMIWRLIKNKDNFRDIIFYNFIYVIISILPFIYIYYLYGINPLFKEWNAQNVLESPKLLHILFGYFIPIIFALLYFVHKVRDNKKFYDLEVILFAWIFSGLALIYAPFNIQRRFVEGLNVPIMLLGSLGFTRILLPMLQDSLKAVMKIKTSKIVITLFVFLLISPTSFYWIYKTNSDVKPGIKVDDYSVPYYLGKDELAALDWLRLNTNKEDVVLSSYGIGNYIPRISGNMVFLGHWAQTIKFEERKSDVTRFFSSNDDNFRSNLISNYGINYVFYGPEENNLGTFNPKNMKIAFQNGKVIIFKA